MPKKKTQPILEINPDDDTPPIGQEIRKYAQETTDFDQVALFQQLFANIFDRNRDKSMGEVLDYLLSDSGAELSNRDLIEKANILGLRPNLYTRTPSEINNE